MDVAGYSLANLRLGLRSDNGWDVFGWVKNAFDAKYFEVLSSGPSTTGLIVGVPGDPRTWGMTAKVQF